MWFLGWTLSLKSQSVVVLSALFIRGWQGTMEMMVYWKITSLRKHIMSRLPHQSRAGKLKPPCNM